MRKFVLAFAGATALAISSAAGAVVTVDSSTMVIDGPTTVANTTTIGFTEAQLASPTFVENVVFTNTLAGLYSITLTTSSPAIDFTSAMLSGGTGGPYGLTEIFDDGTVEFWRLANPITLDAAQYTLSINGNNSGAGSLGGSITISQAAVPEPSTWGMMLFGFGAAGFALRRSRRRRTDLLQLA